MEIKDTYIELLWYLIAFLICCSVHWKNRDKPKGKYEKALGVLPRQYFVVKILFFCGKYFVHFLLFYLILMISTVCVSGRIKKIEDEKNHPTYYSFGKNNRYLIDIELGQLYVQNKTNRKILVHTVANVNGSPYNDFLELSPTQIGKVHNLPTVFFNNDERIKVPFFTNRPGGFINAVNYCE